MLLVLLSLIICVSALAANPQKSRFAGWGKAGYNPDQYKTGFIEKTHPEQPQVGFIRSLSPNKEDFGTIMRTAGISNHKGERIQLISYIKTEDATSAGAWFRVNGKNKTLAFDNMSERRIIGSKKWTQVTLVLDIPEEATSVSYGILLEGTGKVWFHEPRFKVVDQTVKTTERSKSELHQLQLEYEERLAKQKQQINNGMKNERVAGSNNSIVSKKQQ